MTIDWSFLQTIRSESIRGSLVTLGIEVVVALSTFYLLGLVISNLTLVFHWVLSPYRKLVDVWTRRFPFLEWVSLVLQYAVGVLFFLTFIYHTEKLEGHFIGYVCVVVVVLLILAAFGFWHAGRYMEHVPKDLSRIIYYHRFVKPAWDWVAYQSYSLLWLDRIPVLRPVVKALDGAARLVNHRKWQVFLRCMFAFSIFTIPVQLFPDVDKRVSSLFNEGIDAAHLQWLTSPMVSFGELYVLLVDWALTIVLLFLVVSIFSPLEPENLFPSVKEALEHFVKKGKPFVFACYFWQHEPGEYAATPSWPKEQILCPPWEGVARSMHKEALELDKSLPSTWQGVNSRIAAVFEDEFGPEGAAHCVHYRRFGQSAFVVAVGSYANRFEGKDILSSQSGFLQLSESIGLLVNVRHSLKHGSIHLVSRIAK